MNNKKYQHYSSKYLSLLALFYYLKLRILHSYYHYIKNLILILLFNNISSDYNIMRMSFFIEVRNKFIKLSSYINRYSLIQLSLHKKFN